MVRAHTRTGTGGDSEPPPAGAVRPSILVIDNTAHRDQLTDTMRADSLAELVFLDGSSLAAADFEGLRPAAVFVALDGDINATLRIVRTFTVLGTPILCYADRADDWSLARRCEPLLAGAGALLDSSRAEFGENVAGWVRLVLTEARAQFEKAEETRDSMLRHGLVGHSQAIQSVFRKLMIFGSISDLPVLLMGETGTGKELVARAIHALDPKRRSNNFIPVNCGALTASLAESELFGHCRGAFTGAEEPRKGLFRTASGGTLFLDEIGEMDLALQAKLLRVLQERRVLAVGEDREVAVDVRVIAASNRNLQEAVERGTFRADLLYRLNALSLVLPPLRERREDIEDLISDLLEERRSGTGKPAMSPSPDFVRALQSLELRGNVRELMNLVHHALASNTNGTRLELHDLTPEVWAEIAGRGRMPDHLPAASAPQELPVIFLNLLEKHAWNLRKSVACCERMLLEEALRKTKGSQAQAAGLMGLTARSLYNKLQKHKLHSQKSKPLTGGSRWQSSSDLRNSFPQPCEHCGNLFPSATIPA
jgi:transcriptional regulator with GAF, ATPase, and Fis domain